MCNVYTLKIFAILYLRCILALSPDPAALEYAVCEARPPPGGYVYSDK